MNIGRAKFHLSYLKQWWSKQHCVNLATLTTKVVKIRCQQMVLKGACLCVFYVNIFFFNWSKILTGINVVFISMRSHATNDLYEYNSEEVNIEKIVSDIMPTEEKRSRSRAGCDCQLSVSAYQRLSQTKPVFNVLLTQWFRVPWLILGHHHFHGISEM